MYELSMQQTSCYGLTFLSFYSTPSLSCVRIENDGVSDIVSCFSAAGKEDNILFGAIYHF